MELPELNLPEANLKIQNSENRSDVWDLIRKKWVVLTPEEWVRQHLLSYLTKHLNYPNSMIKVETGLKYNTLAKRSDIRVYKGQNVFMLVECKAPSEKINDKALRQIATYQKSVNAKFLVLSNGLQHYCWEQNEETKAFNQMPNMPVFR